ncbi:MAG TPA: carotenoid oxygenase family protein, partial [Pseudomonadales bacterium]
IDDRAQEFPRCNARVSTRPYRFGYCVGVDAGGGFPSIIKHDLKTGTRSTFEFGAGRHGAEPYFVARSGAQAEDDGYLMTFVYDEGSAKSELVIIDAQDLSAAPLAQVFLPTRVPYGFHGSWIPDGATGPSV